MADSLILRLTARAFGALVAASHILLSASAAEPPAPRPDLAALLAPPGKFVSLETHRLYYRCAGSGAPVLVIDNGIGGAAVEWTPIQDALARVTRVCTYDRAGYGWSDTGPGPRTTERSVAELREMLKLAGERGPYVLVGHSFGGFNSRYLAAHHPGEVAGMVLIESSHPEQLLEFEQQAHTARHGINVDRISAGIEAVSPYAAAASFLNSRRKAIFAQMDELAHFEDSAATVTEAGGVGEIPLLVIARGNGEGETAERDRVWRGLQSSLAGLSPDGKLVVARSSSHDLHMADPAFVIEQLKSFVGYVRER